MAYMPWYTASCPHLQRLFVLPFSSSYVRYYRINFLCLLLLKFLHLFCRFLPSLSRDIDSPWLIIILPLEILAFECIPTLKKKFRENLRDANSDCLRMCKAGFKETSRTGFSLDEIYDALGSSKDICSILAPKGEEKLLVDRLVEDEDDKIDVTDIIVDGWINVLTKPDGKIWWQDLYNSDIQSRLPQPVLLEPIVEKPTSVPKSNPLHGLAQLKEKMPKAMKVVFDVVNKKIDLIDSRLTSMEEIVKKQNDWKIGYFGHRNEEQGETDIFDLAKNEVAMDEATIEEDKRKKKMTKRPSRHI